MHHLFKDLLCSILMDLAMKQVNHLIEWLNTVPWQVWFA